MELSDWENTTLGEVITLQRGYDLPSRERKPGNVPIVTSSGIAGTHIEARAKGPGVVTGRYGTIGEVFFINEDYWPHNTTLYVKDFKGNDPLFVSYLLKTIDLQYFSGKSGVPGVNRNDLHEISIEIPYPPEQRTIAGVLSDVDALITLLDRLIAKKHLVKQGAMQELLTGKKRLPGVSQPAGGENDLSGGKISSDGYGRKIKRGYKRTEVGVIPEDWALCILADAVVFLDDRRRPVKESDRAKLKGIYPYYGASGIVDYVNDYLFDEDLILLGEDGENILSRNTRLAFRVFGKIWVNNHAHVLRPKKGFDIGFLSEFLESINYTQYNTGTAQPKLNQFVCANIPIIIPSLAEQRAIATVLSDMDAEISVLEQRCEKIRMLKQGMMQELLTGRTRIH
jgi:type I restriction enzyme, S subunit